MPDGTVLAGGIHALQNDEHRLPAFGKESQLQFGEPNSVVREAFFHGVGFFPAARVTGVNLGQFN